MVSSNVSVSPSPKQPKEHSQLALWSVATVFFLLGSAATAVVIWLLHNLYRATIAPRVTVEGVMQAKYGNEAGDEAMPPPSGYFVESSGIGRVYLTDEPLNSYVGQPIRARGSVSGVCGPKSIPCYPLVEVQEIEVLSEPE